MRNLCPDGYGVFAHQRDQNLFTRTPSFTAFTTERVRAHQPFYTKGGDGLKNCLAIMKSKSLSIYYKFIA